MEQKNKTLRHFAELVSMQKNIENELIVQAKFIIQVQSLMQNERDHLSVINHFPDPYWQDFPSHQVSRHLLQEAAFPWDS